MLDHGVDFLPRCRATPTGSLSWRKRRSPGARLPRMRSAADRWAARAAWWAAEPSRISSDWMRRDRVQRIAHCAD